MNHMSNDIRKCLVIAWLFILSLTQVQAQNSIDKMVENFSTAGSSSFTSVVERDPATRKVNKVVKVLTVEGYQSKKFHTAFMKEKDTGTFTQQRQAGSETLMLTCDKPQQVRIYMLRRNNSIGKITIIVKRKNKE